MVSDVDIININKILIHKPIGFFRNMTLNRIRDGDNINKTERLISNFHPQTNIGLIEVIWINWIIVILTKLRIKVAICKNDILMNLTPKWGVSPKLVVTLKWGVTPKWVVPPKWGVTPKWVVTPKWGVTPKWFVTPK